MHLCLDIAQRAGFAYGRPGDAPKWGSRDFADPGGTGAVVSKFRAWLCERCYELKPSLIAFEAPFIGRNAKTAERLHGMTCTVKSVAWELRIDWQTEAPQSIAKFMLNNGGLKSAEKKAATLAACHAMGFDVGEDDDAADALSLFLMIEAQRWPGLAARRGNGALFQPVSSGDANA